MESERGWTVTKPEFNLLLKLILSLMEKGEHEEVMRLLREACEDGIKAGETGVDSERRAKKCG